MKFKKGQGISLNVIIIAAIALIVLVVLVMIFTGRMNIFGRSLEDQDVLCRDPVDRPGATIRDAADGCLQSERQVYGAFSDVGTGKICCVLAQ
jgi:hypothetical protein